ncbi:MAG: LysR family transcriptional regulator [Myxococcota bacterium]
MAQDLNLLAMLSVLLEEQSVTGAARRLGLSQSAVSHRLRQMREELGDPLLVPAGRGLVLTERARSLQPQLAKAVRALEAAVAPPEPFDPSTSRRAFVVIGTDFGEFTAMPEIVQRLRVEAPGVELHHRPVTGDIPERLARGDADLTIGIPLRETPGLVQRWLDPDPFVLVVRADHPTFPEQPTLEDYLEARHLLVVPRGAPGSPLDELLAARGLKRRVGIRLGHFTTAPFLVARSDLVWTAQTSLAYAAAKFVDLRIMPHPLALPPFRGAMTWHERSQHDTGHRWLRELAFESTKFSPSP